MEFLGILEDISITIHILLCLSVSARCFFTNPRFLTGTNWEKIAAIGGWHYNMGQKVTH